MSISFLNFQFFNDSMISWTLNNGYHYASSLQSSTDTTQLTSTYPQCPSTTTGIECNDHPLKIRKETRTQASAI